MHGYCVNHTTVTCPEHNEVRRCTMHADTSGLLCCASITLTLACYAVQASP